MGFSMLGEGGECLIGECICVRPFCCWFGGHSVGARPFIYEFWLEQTADDGFRLEHYDIVGFPAKRQRTTQEAEVIRVKRRIGELPIPYIS